MKTAVRLTVILLVLIGVAAAAGRALFVADLAHRAERFRLSLGASPPHTEAEVAQVDDKLGGQPALSLLHIIPGGIFLLLAPIQFLPAFRDRHRRAHRVLGRVLLIAVLISGAVGIYFGVVNPIAGVREGIGIALFGSLLIVCAFRAYTAIRRGDVDRHREWMIRTFAIALAISTVRVVAVALDATHTLAFDPRTQFVISVWSGWLITIAAAEFWIRYTRRSTNAHRLPLHHLQQEPGR